LFLQGSKEEATMTMKTISLATAFALASTIAYAQTNNTGSSQAGGSAAPQTTTGDNMKESTTGRSAPSPKDASTQGAGTAGAVNKKGDAASPGGTMKK
jgi:uncharacterized membrane protein